MVKKKWGVLGCAKIAYNQLIPAILKVETCELWAIASRDLDKAQKWAQEFGIPKAYGSYQELIDDPEIDFIYNPLPNPLHLLWSKKALFAQKHVLCEKPLGLNAKEVEGLIEASRQSGYTLAEAFMIHYHPQWQLIKKGIDDQVIGDIVSVESHFSYYNDDPNNIRNRPNFGGGGLLDIGCYCVMISRFIFNEEPLSVSALINKDPSFKVDTLASGLLEFSKGHATFTCGTKMLPHQKVNIIGTMGRVEVELPFNPSKNRAARIYLSKGTPYQDECELLDFDPCDQYALQVESFVKTTNEGTQGLVSLENSLNNSRVLDALFQAGEEKKWIKMKN